ncbi:hypothetical protein WR25_23708 [Diploscapter pachys]|uniref:BPTI/Kunitz inhibitor domain-containing protein n=1 Tax=Diploscapter pachys TaxID=2018661 RepID=A0A2A2JDA3_9BILA|nr:hypothetical protein WR25_23708 [Diploscapter pachys]
MSFFHLLLLLLPSIHPIDVFHQPTSNNPVRLKCPDEIDDEIRSVIPKKCENDADCGSNYYCESFVYSHAAQIKICCPHKENICRLSPDPGSASTCKNNSMPLNRYYFDSYELKCKNFEYFGCVEGNQNRFRSEGECMKFCQNTACLPGSVVRLSAGGPHLCDNSPCPNSDVCRFDSIYKKHVCCTMEIRQQPTQICPTDSHPYLLASSHQPLRCIPHHEFDNCPSKFVCSLSGYCCSSISSTVCPESSTPFIDSVVRQSSICTVGVTQCSMGYSCQNTTNSVLGFCCSNLPTTTSLPLTSNDPFLFNGKKTYYFLSFV